MMIPEEYVDVMALRRQGWKIADIAEAVGYHPATVSSWLKRGGPPEQRQVANIDRVVDERWAARVDELLGTSVERILRAEGFEGSYASLARHLRQVRGVRKGRSPAVSVPIETAPGEEFQFDWSDCCDWGETFGLGPLHCFGAILCWSRRRFWWFTDSIDRAHTFEGLVRFFEEVGGVAVIGRTDRMGCLGHSRGRVFRFDPPAVDFARAHGFALKACAAGDAKRKGKVERPFRELDEALFQELVALGPPASVGELNRRTQLWLEREVHPRPHRVTKASPAERLAAEAPLLAPLPRVRFDTARRETRTVGAPVPLVAWDEVAYSVPPTLVGTLVEVRQPVDEGRIEVLARGQVVARHVIAPPGSAPVWDPEHRRAAEAIALAPHRRHLTVVPEPAPRPAPEPSAPLVLGTGDFDVDTPDLDRYEVGCGCQGQGA